MSEKKLKLVISDKTRKNINNLDGSFATQFVQLSLTILDDIDTIEKIPASLWFSHTDEKTNELRFYEFITTKNYNEKSLERMKKLAEKYNDQFPIFIRINDQLIFERFKQSCLSRKWYESQSNIDTNTEIGKLKIKVQNTMKNIAYGENIPEIKKQCDEIVGMIIYQVLETKNISDIIKYINDSNDKFLDQTIMTSIISVIICKKAGMSEETYKKVGLCAMIHDIGLYYLDPEIIMNEGILKPAQFKEYKTHTELGADIIEQLTNQGARLPPEALIVCRQHHEKLNGTGYPNQLYGLQEKEGRTGMHIYTRIISVADAYCNYLGKVKNHKKALEVIFQQADNFDSVFLKLLV